MAKKINFMDMDIDMIISIYIPIELEMIFVNILQVFLKDVEDISN